MQVIASAYDLTGPIGTRATLGLIVLQVDETIEQDFRRLFSARDVALYISRIPSGAHLTTDTIAAMETDLPAAAALLPPAASFDAIGYGCTSGTTQIGAARVAALIRGAAPTGFVADPLTAALTACTRLGVGPVGIVSPYVAPVFAPIRAAFAAAGHDVRHCASFGEQVEARVARIDPASIYAAALQVGQDPEVEAVFLSCTNLRTLDILEDLERVLRKPVISSNQVLAWQMAQAVGILPLHAAPGALFRT